MPLFKKIIPILITLMISLYAVNPLFKSGFFPMHDDTQPSRVFVMADALKQGQFPVRWVDHLGYGYGYPLFNFYAPLPYYVGAVGVLLGLNVIVATKLMFVIGALLSAVTMYLLGCKLWGKIGGLITSLAYVMLPYHAVQIYVRGAVGEYWAYGLLPLVFYGLLELNETPQFGIIVGSLAFAAVILSHNITGLILFGLLGTWLTFLLVSILLKHETFSKFSNTFKMIICGIAIAAFFWLPALKEANFTKVNFLTQGSNNYKLHFVYLDQLWDSPWGFAGSASGRNDGMSFKLGKLHVITAGIAISLILVRKIKNKFNLFLYWSGLALLVSVFMMLTWSDFIWQLHPLFAFIQYPWRFLTFSGILMTLFIGGLTQIMRDFNKSIKIIFAVLMIMVFLGFNGKYFQPELHDLKTDADYTSESNLRWKISKISDEYLPQDFPIPQTKKETAQEKIQIPDGIILESDDISPQRVSLKFKANLAGKIRFSIAYFPGWNIVLDGNKVLPEIQEGLITLSVPQGNHQMTVLFENTPVRTISNLITILAIIFELVMISNRFIKFKSAL